VNHIEELKQAIRELHGAEAIHVRTVPVRETHQGNTREGLVEVFDLRGHSQAKRAYAWTDETENPDKESRQVTVLHIYPVTSPEAAVKSTIEQDCRNP
jgi:hypothetical protein